MSIYPDGSSGGGGSVTTAQLNLGDPAIYDVATNKITIPAPFKSSKIFVCLVPMYFNIVAYAINAIVLSDGTNGGVAGLCYKSLANGNGNNALSNPAFWSLADATISVPGTGAIDVSTFGNPNSLPTDHTSAFRVQPSTMITPSFSMLFIAGGSHPATGQLFLDFNTDVLLSNPNSEISFAVVNDVSVKQPAPIQ